jgi:hypothetical protein
MYCHGEQEEEEDVRGVMHFQGVEKRPGCNTIQAGPDPATPVAG